MTGFAGARRPDPRDSAVSRPPVSRQPFPVIIRAIHGRVGDVIYKTYGRKIVVTRVPCFDGYVPSPAQRARMAEATAYAKHIYADPAAKAHYVAAAKKLGRHPFRLAICDYLSQAAHREQAEKKSSPWVLPRLASAQNRLERRTPPPKQLGPRHAPHANRTRPFLRDRSFRFTRHGCSITARFGQHAFKH